MCPNFGSHDPLINNLPKIKSWKMENKILETLPKHKNISSVFMAAFYGKNVQHN
jgi:hypothetical protein